MVSRISAIFTGNIRHFCSLKPTSSLFENVLYRSEIQLSSRAYSRGVSPSQAIKQLDLKSSPSPSEDTSLKRVLNSINSEVEKRSCGRLFAVVSIAAKQFKVTEDDLIMIQHNFPGEVGARIRLNKVLLVGSSSFTAIGRPLLGEDQVTVFATVVERTLSQQIVYFRSKKRSPYQQFNFHRVPLVALRINSIEINKCFEE